MNEPKFEVYKDKMGDYRFKLTAANGEIIAISEGYKTRQGCLKGIASVQRNAGKAKIECGTEEITAKQLVKKLIIKEKEYADKKLPEIIKTKEEIEDEKKTVVVKRSGIALPSKSNIYWL